jgi:Fe-S-cluster containining protein
MEKSNELLLILRKALKSPFTLDFSSYSYFSRFTCLQGCQKCCGYGYYLPTEIIHLENRVKEKLILEKDGKYVILRDNGRCTFYNSNIEFSCSIYDQRPLRCKIYPYFPLIVEQRIIITMEPALKMKNYANQIKECPGIGKSGKALQKSIDECLLFLEKLIDVPELLSTIILDHETFNKIRDDRWFIEHQNEN